MPPVGPPAVAESLAQQGKIDPTLFTRSQRPVSDTRLLAALPLAERQDFWHYARAMPKHPGGRPSRPDKAAILQAVIAGLERGVPLTVAVEPFRAARNSVYDWMKADPDVKEAVQLARELGFDWLAHECLEIADDARNDWMERHGKDGEFVGWQFNNEHFQRSRLRIETRLRLLRAWDPSRYGERAEVKVEGEVTTTVQHTLDPRQMDEEGRAALREVLAHAKAQGLLQSPEPIDAEFEEAEPSDPEDDVADG